MTDLDEAREVGANQRPADSHQGACSRGWQEAREPDMPLLDIT
ncbi:hypothetical protein [Noviherbaspirillum sp.]